MGELKGGFKKGNKDYYECWGGGKGRLGKERSRTIDSEESRPKLLEEAS